MYYFRVKDNMVEKYEVIFDKNEVIDLRDEILLNCSEKVHKKYESDYDPDLRGKKVENFTYKKVGVKEYFEETRDVYEYSYDEYDPPYLCEILNDIVYAKDEEDRLDSVMMLFDSKIVEKPSLDERIEVMSDIFNKEKDSNKRLEYLEKLNELLIIKKNSPKIKPVIDYYDRARELINIELVDTIPVADVDKVIVFFNAKIDVKYQHEDILGMKNKVMKKKK